MHATAVPYARLRVSQANVRKIERDAGLDALAASIAEHGLLQPLVVSPAKGRKPLFDIHAGARRWRAIGLLIERDLWPEDRMVDVRLLDCAEASAREASLAENILREAMAPADEARAYHDVIADGADVEAVARRFGVTVRHVQGRLRLADLADPIFEALAGGDITLDVAMAYGATGDQARQLLVWERLSGNWQGENPQAIRRALADDALAADHPVALFLGEAEYLACGGRIERDLFSEEGQGSWIDGELARDLAMRKLAHEADVAALGCRLGWVRPCLASCVTHDQTRDLQVYWPQQAEPTAEVLARIAEIEARMGDIADALDEAPDGSEDGLLEQEYDALALERDRLRRTDPIIPDEDRLRVGTFLRLDLAGRPQLHDMFYRIRAVDADEEGRVSEERGPMDTEAAPAPSAYPRSLEEQLAMDRRDVLALHVARDPELALDLAMFSLASAVAEPGCPIQTGCTVRLGDRGDPKGVNGIPPSQAALQLSELEAVLGRGWCQGDDAFAAFQEFRRLDVDTRLAWLALAVGRSLRASLAGGDHDLPFQTQLGALIGIDTAQTWRPGAEGFFDRLRKAAILEILGDIDPSLPARHVVAKKAELAGIATRLCAGEAIVEADIRQRALAWVPEVMRFVTPLPSAAEDDDASHQAGQPAQAT
jgi:ParB family chromosome partitioning protein